MRHHAEWFVCLRAELLHAADCRVTIAFSSRNIGYTPGAFLTPGPFASLGIYPSLGLSFLMPLGDPVLLVSSPLDCLLLTLLDHPSRASVVLVPPR